MISTMTYGTITRYSGGLSRLLAPSLTFEGTCRAGLIVVPEFDLP